MAVHRRRLTGAVAVGLALVLAATTPASASGGFSPGAPGVGDPYYPGYGNGGYDVAHYNLDVRYDPATSRLCLRGDGIEGQEGTVVDGELCGTWRRTQGSGATPRPGDAFRFVSVEAGGAGASGPGGEAPPTVIYGDVVR